MKVFNWQNIRLVVLLLLIIFLYSFTKNRNESRKLVGSEVVFVGENNLFLKQETVNKLLIENFQSAKSIQKVKLDLNKLEKSVNKCPMVEKSEVFVTINGVLKAVVKQKTPIGRFVNGDDSFYIDIQGNTMPLSDHFTARVPLIYGTIATEYKQDFVSLLQLIYKDDFLRKNIIGIQIAPNGGLKMMNRNYDYEIEFGRTINVESKFKNYKAFFQKASLDSSLYHYKKINLKFTQQVVCTK